MNNHIISHINLLPDALTITWGDDHQSIFHYIWLRDNEPQSRFAVGQRINVFFDIPLDIKPVNVQINGTLDITWPDNSTYRFDPTWLRANTYEPEDISQRRPTRKLWKGRALIQTLMFHHYDDIMSKKTKLRDLFQAIEDYGFAILKGVPTKSGMIFEIVKLFGYIRETNDGAMHNIAALADPQNAAYIKIKLVNHIDNPYRLALPALQLLHSLVNTVDGGESTLVDSLFLAQELRNNDPEAFQYLVTTPVTHRYDNGETVLEHESTIIELDIRNQIVGVRWNPMFIQPFYAESNKMKDFYAAYQKFGKMANDEANKLIFKLKSGDLLLFNNWRVMHGRQDFNPKTGIRHLQGCYADIDALQSKLAVLNRQLTN